MGYPIGGRDADRPRIAGPDVVDCDNHPVLTDISSTRHAISWPD